MKTMLLGLAASLAAVLPAAANAQAAAGAGFALGSGFDHSDGLPGEHPEFVRDGSRFDRYRGDHRDRHRDRDNVVIGWGYYSQDFDGNRAFDPTRYNDWWHDNPQRAYPAWMSRNGNCQRQWWSGGGWTC